MAIFVHFFGDLTGAVYLLDDYVWRTTQYHYRGQNREQRENDQAKPVTNKIIKIKDILNEHSLLLIKFFLINNTESIYFIQNMNINSNK